MAEPEIAKGSVGVDQLPPRCSEERRYRRVFNDIAKQRAAVSEARRETIGFAGNSLLCLGHDVSLQPSFLISILLCFSSNSYGERWVTTGVRQASTKITAGRSTRLFRPDSLQLEGRWNGRRQTAIDGSQSNRQSKTVRHRYAIGKGKGTDW